MMSVLRPSKVSKRREENKFIFIEFFKIQIIIIIIKSWDFWTINVLNVSIIIVTCGLFLNKEKI